MEVREWIQNFSYSVADLTRSEWTVSGSTNERTSSQPVCAVTKYSSLHLFRGVDADVVVPLQAITHDHDSVLLRRFGQQRRNWLPCRPRTPWGALTLSGQNGRYGQSSAGRQDRCLDKRLSAPEAP